MRPATPCSPDQAGICSTSSIHSAFSRACAAINLHLAGLATRGTPAPQALPETGKLARGSAQLQPLVVPQLEHT